MANRTRRHIAYYCSFCGRNSAQVRRLIAGPNGVYVCNECTTTFHSETHESQKEDGLHCSFCTKDQTQVAHITRGPYGVCICSECVKLCIEIITEEESYLPGNLV